MTQIRLQRLELNNWGIYEGHQEVNFDSNVDVFCIHGANGSGKGHFISAVTYLIYGYVNENAHGENKTGRGNADNFIEYLQSYLNKNALDDGKEDFYVRARFTDTNSGYTYDLRKDIRVFNKKATEAIHDFTFYEKDGSKLSLSKDEKKDIIKNLFKPGLREFFFVDGEGFRTRGKKITEVSRKETIQNLCGLEKLNIGNKLIEEKYNAVSEEIRKASRDLEKAKEAYKQIESAEESNDQQEKTKKEKEKEREKLEEEMQDQIDFLKKNERARNYLDDIKELDQDIKNIEMDNKAYIEEINKNRTDFFWNAQAYKFIYPKLNIDENAKHRINNLSAIDNLNKLKNSSSIIYDNTSEEFKTELNDILEKNQSLLNNEDNEMQKNMFELHSELQKHKERSENAARIFKEITDNYGKIEVIKKQKEKKRTDLQMELPAHSQKEDEKKITQYSQKYTKNEEKIEKIKKDIDDCIKKIKNNKKQIENAHSAIAKYGDEKLSITQKVYQDLNKILDRAFSELANPIKKDLQEEVQEHWINLLRDSKKHYSASFTDDYTLQPSLNCSTGEKQLLEYSLTAVLAKKLPWLPLFLDAPFADLDEDHKKRVTKTWADFKQQLVIFNHPDSKKDGAFNKSTIANLLENKSIKHIELQDENLRTKIIQN